MGSPVSHIYGKGIREKHTRRCAPAARAKRARGKAPPSASAAAALPGEGDEPEKAKRATTMQCSKEAASPAEGSALVRAESNAAESINEHLRERGINPTGRKAQAVVRQWANDPGVTLEVLDAALDRLAEADDVRSPMGLLPLLVQDVLIERAHPMAKRTKGRRGGLPPPRTFQEAREAERRRVIEGLTGYRSPIFDDPFDDPKDDPNVIDITPNDDS